ncbi:MAG: hypothetical protein A2Z27_01620 [candidate division Zixibacteria bacterium RBG_16_50_21]|nr:MAG: hypothetical protein A2Z27_01620 [candidate division Zixibacteria bacterium RBG_16_50_21]
MSVGETKEFFCHNIHINKPAKEFKKELPIVQCRPGEPNRYSGLRTKEYWYIIPIRRWLVKHLNVHCEVCGHRAESIFCSLAGTHLEKLEREKTVHRYEKGQVIIYEGTPAYAIHCIYSGRVKIYKTGQQGEQQIIRLLGPGEIFGYRALLAQELCAASVEAIEPTVICTISKDTLFQLLRQSPELTARLLAKMARELKASEDLMLSLAQESVKQRTAKLLLFLWEGGKGETGVEGSLRISLQRLEMAHMVGTTPETFSRTLRHLASKGILNLSRSQITIKNLPLLQLVARES